MTDPHVSQHNAPAAVRGTVKKRTTTREYNAEQKKITTTREYNAVKRSRYVDDDGSQEGISDGANQSWWLGARTSDKTKKLIATSEAKPGTDI